MHLFGVQYMDHRQQRADLDIRQGFFHGLARRGLLQGLTVLHEARRDRPEAEPGFDGTPTDEDATRVVLRHATDHQFRILVVHGLAGQTDEAKDLVARWDAPFNAGAACAAVFHGVFKWCRERESNPHSVARTGF